MSGERELEPGSDQGHQPVLRPEQAADAAAETGVDVMQEEALGDLVSESEVTVEPEL